jgi:hypothetical protein
MVNINLDNVVNGCYLKVKNVEDGLDLIKKLTQGHDFEVPPDLNIKETKILGKHIFTKHHELYSTNKLPT